MFGPKCSILRHFFYDAKPFNKKIKKERVKVHHTLENFKGNTYMPFHPLECEGQYFFYLIFFYFFS